MKTKKFNCGLSMLSRVAFALSFFFCSFITAQTITGTVINENGSPLPGANVIVKGDTIGTSTDFDGNFSLSDVEIGTILKVSYTGYTNQEIVAAANMQIQLLPSNQLDEIIVRAENRNVSAQKVPITMDIVSGAKLTDQGITDFKQLQGLAPSLSIVQNESFTPIFIRGVGTQETGVLTDQSASLNIDGEFITRPIALNVTLFDLERIEVLKGPQGTLYGKNSTAGAVNLVAAKPKLGMLGGRVQYNNGNYNTNKANVALNVPLGEKSAIRAAFVSDKHDGYRQSNGDPDNGGYRGEIDNGNALGARLGFLTKPNDKLSIYIAGEYNQVDQLPAAQYGISSEPGQAAYDPGLAAFEGQQPIDFETDLPDDFDVAVAGFQKINQRAIRANLSYNFTDNFKFTYRGGFRDISGSTYQPLNGWIPENFSFERNREFESQSHEFRLNGDSAKFIWQAGLYLGKDVSNTQGGLIFAFARFLSAPAFDKVPYGFYNNWDTEVSNTGVFGQATYNFSDKVALTGGLRYTNDQKTQSGYEAGAPFGPPGTAVYFYPNGPAEGDQGTSPIVGGDETFTQLTWLANLEYKPNETSMHFAKISTGYKSGGFTVRGPFDAEFLTSFELGSKNRLSDNFRLNASTFLYNYRDQQIPVFIDIENGFDVANAGESRIFGVELEGDYAFSKKDRLSLKVNYLNAELTKFTTEVNRVNAPAVAQDISGNRPAQSPELVSNLAYTHMFSLGSKGATLETGFNTLFKSNYFLTPFNNRMDRQDAYTRTDLSATYTSANGNWDIGVYINNLEDNRILTYANYLGDEIMIYNWIFGAPRLFGAKISYRFGKI